MMRRSRLFVSTVIMTGVFAAGCSSGTPTGRARRRPQPPRQPRAWWSRASNDPLTDPGTASPTEMPPASMASAHRDDCLLDQPFWLSWRTVGWIARALVLGRFHRPSQPTRHDHGSGRLHVVAGGPEFNALRLAEDDRGERTGRLGGRRRSTTPWTASTRRRTRSSGGSLSTARPRRGFDPFGLALDGADLWVSDFDQGLVLRVDTASGRVTTMVAGIDHPEGLAVGFGSVWVVEHRIGGDRTDQISRPRPLARRSTCRGQRRQAVCGMCVDNVVASMTAFGSRSTSARR